MSKFEYKAPSSPEEKLRESLNATSRIKIGPSFDWMIKVVIPVLILGSFLGIYLSGILRRDIFRKVALVIVILAGISSFISGLGMI